MNFLEQELNSILFENIDNFEKDFYVIVYGKEINMNLELDNWIRSSHIGEGAFKKAIDNSIENYNSCKECVKLNFTAHQFIMIRADFSQNLNEILDGIKILLNNIDIQSETQMILGHIKDKDNHVVIDIMGHKNYCDCKYRYSWKHLYADIRQS